MYYFFPFLLDFYVSGYFLLVVLRAVNLNATPGQIGIIGVLSTGAYTLTAYAVAKLVKARHAKRLMIAASALCLLNTFGVLHSSLGLLAVRSALIGLGSALFFPVFQIWMSSGPAPGMLFRRVACYNVSWSLGMACAAALSGYFKETAPGLAVSVIIGIMVVMMVAILFLPAAPPAPDAAGEECPLTLPPPDRHRQLLMLSIGLMFFTAFSASAIRTFYAKLGAALNFSEAQLGIIVGALTAMHAPAAWIMYKNRWWLFRFGIVLVAFGFSLAAVAAVSWTSSFPVVLAGTLLLSLGNAIAYMCTITYAGSFPGKREFFLGLNESLVGLAGTGGPLVAAATGAISLRLPFQAICGIGLVTFLALLFGLRRRV